MLSACMCKHMSGGWTAYFFLFMAVQLAGPDAVATYDVMDTMRSTLAEFLPVTYNSVSPVAYKNVTSCPELASPASAPIGPIELPSLPAEPPSSHTMGGRHLLNRWPVGSI